MALIFYTNVISAHQLPLAKELVKRLGAKGFRYVYTGDEDGVRQEVRCHEPWIEHYQDETQCETVETLLVGGIRPIDLLERRLAAGRKTLYMSERWFKPWRGLPGWLRLLVPSYFKMARRFAKLFANPNFLFLPIGPWALADMRLLCQVMNVVFPGDRVVPWGYFVEASKRIVQSNAKVETTTRQLRVLWVGRMIRWKRVDTLIKAVRAIDPRCISLTLVGDGDQRQRLLDLSRGATNITFKAAVPIDQVRKLMREHDLYVLPSNSEEGWGAALNEAMSEGLNVLGTYEAGASAALLPASHLFHAGDWHRLKNLLMNPPPQVKLAHRFTPAGAAEVLLSL